MQPGPCPPPRIEVRCKSASYSKAAQWLPRAACPQLPTCCRRPFAGEAQQLHPHIQAPLARGAHTQAERQADLELAATRAEVQGGLAWQRQRRIERYVHLGARLRVREYMRECPAADIYPPPLSIAAPHDSPSWSRCCTFAPLLACSGCSSSCWCLWRRSPRHWLPSSSGAQWRGASCLSARALRGGSSHMLLS